MRLSVRLLPLLIGALRHAEGFGGGALAQSQGFAPSAELIDRHLCTVARIEPHRNGSGRYNRKTENCAEKHRKGTGTRV